MLTDRLAEIIETWPDYYWETYGVDLQQAANEIMVSLKEGVEWNDAVRNRTCVKKARSAWFEVRHWFRYAQRNDMFDEVNERDIRVMIEVLGEKVKEYHEALESFGRRGGLWR